MSRLIDADALKKDFEKVYPLSTNEMGGVINKRIYELIDNAPTIYTECGEHKVEADTGDTTLQYPKFG